MGVINKRRNLELALRCHVVKGIGTLGGAGAPLIYPYYYYSEMGCVFQAEVRTVGEGWVRLADR